MILETSSSNVTIYVSPGESTTSAELQCEATGYVRPDSDIQWYRGNERIERNDEKYSIAFRNGRPNAAQRGLNESTFSRVSVLTIQNVDETDAGLYSCRSQETSEVTSMQLNIEIEPGKFFKCC